MRWFNLPLMITNVHELLTIFLQGGFYPFVFPLQLVYPPPDVTRRLPKKPMFIPNHLVLIRGCPAFLFGLHGTKVRLCDNLGNGHE